MDSMGCPTYMLIEGGDPGKYTLDSREGQKIYQKTSALHKKAGNSLKLNHLKEACANYSMAIKKGMEVRENSVQVASLLTDRSRLYCQMCMYQQAVLDAEFAIRCRPTFLLGAEQLAKVYYSRRWYSNAMIICFETLLSFHMKKELIVRFAKLWVQSAARTTNSNLQLRGLSLPAEAWASVITELTREEDWESLGELLLTDGGQSKAVITEFSLCGDVDLSSLLQSETSAWIDWAQELVLAFLKNCTTAKFVKFVKTETSSAGVYTKEDHTKKGVSLLYAATNMALKTGSCDLLEYLLKAFQQQKNVTDKRGNTLLHRTCRDDKLTYKKAVIYLLLDVGVDPSVKNLNGESAGDLLSESELEMHNLLSGSPLSGVSSLYNTADEGEDDNYEDAIVGPQCAGWREWTVQQLQAWLWELNLRTDRFGELDGHLLAELKEIQTSGPKLFHLLLTDLAQLSGTDVIKLSQALRNLK